jgi:hypothetical protein
MTKKTPVKRVKKEDYEASIKVLGQVYKSKGGSAKEAIESLKVGSVARGMSILTMKKGKITREKILPTHQTSRLFSPSKLVREIALKNVSLMFDF